LRCDIPVEYFTHAENCENTMIVRPHGDANDLRACRSQSIDRLSAQPRQPRGDDSD